MKRQRLQLRLSLKSKHILRLQDITGAFTTLLKALSLKMSDKQREGFSRKKKNGRKEGNATSSHSVQ